MPPAVSKTERIDVRVSPTAKNTLQMAATQVNKTVSQFLLDAALTLVRSEQPPTALSSFGYASVPPFPRERG